MDAGGATGVHLQMQVRTPKLPTVRVSTGICSLVLVHTSQLVMEGGDSGSGAENSWRTPCTSRPSIRTIPRATTFGSGGRLGAAGSPGVFGNGTCGGMGTAGTASTRMLASWVT